MKKIVMIITCFVLINLMIYPINANALYEDYTLVDEIKYKEDPISLFGADLEKDDHTASKEFYLRLMQNNGDKRKFIVIFNNKWTTLAQAKSVYFSMNGMGNVFEIPSNLSGYYDNTPGLCLEYQI